tara:strand:+ start:33 stop:770 length:738 start_codon:yes stop_codon:yes gene_type:complete
MLTNNEIKFINSLNHKKNRDSNSLFLVEGDKIINELISSDFRIKKIYGTYNWYEDNRSIIEEELFCKVSPKELSRISNLKSPNNVLAIVNKKNFELEQSNLTGLTLVLDSINDPGNLGTIIRSCHWFNIKNIICSENTVDMYNSKVIQSTMGSIFNVNIFYTELTSFLNDCSNNHTIYGSFLDGDDIKKIKINSNTLLVIGSESHGISNSIVNKIHKKVTIKGKSEEINSLNVATATSIMLYEFS